MIEEDIKEQTLDDKSEVSVQKSDIQIPTSEEEKVGSLISKSEDKENQSVEQERESMHLSRILLRGANRAQFNTITHLEFLNISQQVKARFIRPNFPESVCDETNHGNELANSRTREIRPRRFDNGKDLEIDSDAWVQNKILKKVGLGVSKMVMNLIKKKIYLICQQNREQGLKKAEVQFWGKMMAKRGVYTVLCERREARGVECLCFHVSLDLVTWVRLGKVDDRHVQFVRWD